MEAHLSQLQDIVRLTIRQELEWSERRLKRVVMSHDASDNPAELYGADGKIYYRKAGGVGGEIGTGDEGDARYVRKDAGAGSQIMRNDLEFVDYQTLEFKDNAGAPVLCGAIFGFNGTTLYDFVVRSYNSGVLTLLSAAGYIACSGDRLSDVGTPSLGGDAANKTYVDGVAGVTAHSALSQLDYASSGHTGFSAAHSHPYLPLAGGTMSALASINMSGGTIDNLDFLHANDTGGIDLVTSGAVTSGYLATSAYALRCVDLGIYMNGKKIENVGAGVAASTDAARMADLTSYLLLVGGVISGNLGFSTNAGIYRSGIETQFIALDGGAVQPASIRVYGKDATNSGDIEFKVPNGAKIAQLTAGKFDGANDSPKLYLYYGLDMSDKNIENISTLKGYGANNLSFYDAATGTKTLSELAAGLWEVSGSVIRPKGYDIIEGRTTQNLTVRPASGGILYLG